MLADGHSVKTMLTTWDEDGQTDMLKRDCSICSINSVAASDSGAHLAKESSTDDCEENSMTMVPLKKLEDAPSLISLFKESAELKPGWPLLGPTILSCRKPQDSSHVRQIPVVEWAMQLPSRYCSSIENLNSEYGGERDQSCELDGESGAMVSVVNGTVPIPSSPDCILFSLPDELEGLHQKYSATCRFFKFHELVSVTSNFSPDKMIGKGGSSQVYKGCLPDGKELAIKILKHSEDSLKEFVLEIEIITALRHKNIMSLFGFCFEDDHLLLVYDFLSRGSLEENLYAAGKEPLVLCWKERYKVAIGVAEALDYLHEREPQPVIHRDIKSSNILLSDDFEPQLSDFGLAKWASPTSSHITCTYVAGTFGYLAPEYFIYGKVNEKIDVYAYGVVLLELLSGRKPISSNYPKGQESLVMWAKPILNHGKFACLLDPNLGDRYDREESERMVLAASLCIRRAPRARPQMSFVLKILQGDKEATKWARLQVHASEGSDMKLKDSALEGSESDMLDDDTFSRTNLRSHLNLALLGVEEDTVSVSSIEQSVSLEDNL